MARLSRMIAPGLPHHIILRGNNRQAVFFEADDYMLFRLWLNDAARREGCDIHSYVLMTNHFHLLVTPARADGISRMMQSLGRRYVRHINRAYRRSGTLWEGRFRSAPVDAEDYLLTCMRYIELNPVRARMVKQARSYDWSSYRANALGAADGLVTPHPVYTRLGSTPEERQTAYRALFQRKQDEEQLENIRSSTQGGWAIGGEKFREEITRTLKRRAAPLPRGGDRSGGKDTENEKKQGRFFLF